jgi:hypothetical protein
MLISDSLFERKYPDLLRIGDNDRLGTALVQDGVYIVSAGASHTAQYGLLGMLRAANNGEFKFLENVKVYGEKAAEMKQIFIANGFQILYDRDGDENLADGFYFTVTYPGIDEEELSRRFYRCGLGTVSLKIMGSKGKPGVRISTAKIEKKQFNDLNIRLKQFSCL